MHIFAEPVTYIVTLNTTNISEEDRKKYGKTIEQFDTYFKVKTNVIYERVCFNKCSQLPDEPVDCFITEIHTLVESCEFGEMKQELIRDQLIVGIQDLALSEWLQLEPNLILDKAKRLICQCEAVRFPTETAGKRGYFSGCCKTACSKKKKVTSNTTNTQATIK